MDRILAPFVVLLCLAGLGVSIDLTRIHVKVHTDPSYQSFCAYSKGVNCDTVAQSPYSLFAAVPVAVWGILGYLLMGGFAISLWRARLKNRYGYAAAAPLLGLTLFATTVSIVLAYISFTKIASICVLCFTTYGINILLLGLTFYLACRPSGLVSCVKKALGYFLLENKKITVGLLVVGITCVGGLVTAYPRYWVQEYDAMVGPQGLPVGVDENGLAWIGANNPVITIVEFSDYQCPYCPQRHRDARALVKKYPTKVRLAHRHYPLDQHCHPRVRRRFHDQACRLATLTICAGRQNKGWQANDLLYSWPRRQPPPDAETFAEKLELDLEKLKECIQDPSVMDQIRKDIQAGIKLRIRGTPTFVVDGKKFVGRVPKKLVEKTVGAGAEKQTQ
jgi:protein-disulfide isomerase/uncharacterized membrane protein